MDDRGFIFTADATLALVVVIVLTTSLVTYQMLPAFMGEDHQHLEALADSVLAVMEQDGTLYAAAMKKESGNDSGAQQLINDDIKRLIPNDIAYNLTLTINSSAVVSGSDDRGISVSRDRVTKVKVISAPREDWMGRAWYKIENFTFVDNTQTVTTTLWNFHNWLTNFAPWNGNGNLRTYHYWGKGLTSQNIQFPVPNGAILGAKFLIGCDNRNNGNPFGATVNINGNAITFNQNQPPWVYLNNRPGGYSVERMYNYQGDILSTMLSKGVLNNFYVNFQNMNNNQNYDLPWFSIIGTYNATFPVPKGIMSNTYNFSDAAGLAVPDAQDLDGDGVFNEYGRTYYIDNGTVTSFTNQRVIDWSNMRNQNHAFADGTPFVITGVPGVSGGHATGVSIVKDINIPSGNDVLDSFVVVNAYGGVDSALVEVYNGTDWRTIFCSFDVDGTDYSAVNDGYGNIPGIIYIPKGYLIPGANNKVRITVWDDAPGSDYDLVGLTNCYVTTIYSALNVGWDTTPFNSHQSSNNVETQTKSFYVNETAKEALLFVGAGTDSRTITVKYPTGQTLYSGSVPYYLDLAALDAKLGFHILTTANSTETSYWLNTNRTYNLTVTVNGPTNKWESGDDNAYAEIFSGTRISVIYPESLRNAWWTEFDNTPDGARTKAGDKLYDLIDPSHSHPEYRNDIKTEALYTGAMPNQIPVRLDLWKQ